MKIWEIHQYVEIKQHIPKQSNEEWVKEVTRKIIKYFETNKNENITYHNSWMGWAQWLVPVIPAL